ncbi:MAG TPA: hypothetical protein VF230_05060 [Acidimicrobiales bacterium]
MAPALPEPDGLDRLVTIVAAATAQSGWHASHRLVRVERRVDDEFELGMLDLPYGSHPISELLGFVAPPSWEAIGLVTYGWGAPADRVRPSEHPERRRVRLVTLVDRDGREAATASFDDGTVIDESPEGVLTDVLRRCLRVPTAPPPPHAVLVDSIWVENVLRDAKRSGRGRMTWARVASLRRADALPSSWAETRAAAVVASPFWADVGPWMDDGMFARWVLGNMRPLADMLRKAERRLSKDVARRLRAAVAPSLDLR